MEGFFPSLEEFERTAERGDVNVVPVSLRVLSDVLTPVGAYSAVGRAGRFSFLLESVTGGEKVARYSFVGLEPFCVLRVEDGRTVVEDPFSGTRRVEEGDPLEVLRGLLSRYRAFRGGLPPLCAGGAVGYIGYDMVRRLEPLDSPPPDVLGMPEMYMCLFDTMVVLDHIDNTAHVVYGVRLDEFDSAAEAYRHAVERILGVVDMLAAAGEDGTPAPLLEVEEPGEVLSIREEFGREAFEQAVARSKEYIAAGDIFQVVLSRRVFVENPPDPLSTYRLLRVVNPSPYMFLLKLDDVALVGSSPEVMVRLENGVVTVRPIAGTRRRGGTPEEDERLAKELLSDEKELAEHAMLLDLGRNDVGRVSVPGSVRVTEKMIVERYSHVMHITSNVEGKVKLGADAVDVLSACLPAGTVSGAPKVRAMQIIDELEPSRRGPYAGAVGYFDFAGDMDTCIAIRTVVFSGGEAWVQAGAGIVADSVPEREYEETCNKARAMLKAVAMAARMRGAAG